MTKFTTTALTPAADTKIAAELADGSKGHVLQSALRDLLRQQGQWYVVAQSAVQQTRTSVNGAGDATASTLATVTIPANAMGPNGSVRVTATFDGNDTSSTKTYSIRWATTGGTAVQSITATTSGGARLMGIVQNRGATNSQFLSSIAAGAGGWSQTTAHGTAAADTTASVDIIFRCNWSGATSAETLSLEAYIVEVCYGA